MKTSLDMEKIAHGLGVERGQRVSAKGGYFGVMQLIADVTARFRVPGGGGRPTDPQWTERRLVPLAPQTLERLEELTARIRERGSASLEPMQLAGLLLEKATERLSEEEAKSLLRPSDRVAERQAAYGSPGRQRSRRGAREKRDRRLR
jgi:hypothetical protein